MKVNERALQDVHTSGGGGIPLCIGFTSNALPRNSKLCSSREKMAYDLVTVCNVCASAFKKNIKIGGYFY